MKLKRTTKKEAQNIEWHLRDQRTKKWLVQCVVCQRVGYKPGVPEKFFGRKHLIAYFEPLHLDDTGICSQCHNAVQQETKTSLPTYDQS